MSVLINKLIIVPLIIVSLKVFSGAINVLYESRQISWNFPS